MKKRNAALLSIACLLLGVLPAHAERVLSWKRAETSVNVEMEGGRLTLTPMERNAIRVQYRAREAKAPELPELIYVRTCMEGPFRAEEKAGVLEVATERLRACLDLRRGHLVFRDAEGRVLLSEAVDGRQVRAAEVQKEACHEVEQRFHSPADERLYGMGQFQDGYLNIRGLTRRLTQLNTQIAIPFLLSSKGYGLLWHNYGLTDFNPATDQVALQRIGAAGASQTVSVTTPEGTQREVRTKNAFAGKLSIRQAGTYALLLDVGQSMARKHKLSIDGKLLIDVNNIWLPRTTSLLLHLEPGEHEVLAEGVNNDRPELFFRPVTEETVLRSPVADGIDYTVFAGFGDEAIASYRTLTGAAPLMPRWALGYIHCRERFHSQEELLDNAREFRKRGLPVDVMVQDWQYWGRYGWNAMRFDERHYPDPAAMVRELHAMDMRLMLSVWSKIDQNCEVGRAAKEKGHYIPGTSWIDFFDADAAAFYWRHFSDNLLKPNGIDAWWQDATEPENDDLAGRRVNRGKWAGERVRNVYPLMVNKTVYEGLRADAPGKRAMILTRSGFSGMQRYAAATWSGDVGNDWETLRRQIAGGLNQMASGLPWWTYDAGGFFRPGNQYKDKGFHERFLRWFQAATFLPLQRVHGYQTNTEFWRFGPEVTRIAHRYLDFRYRMLPYLYSEAAAVTLRGSTLMRPFVMDFAHDPKALDCRHAYMFGPALLVAPVVGPGVNTWPVYLPQHREGWYDFWTGERHRGGQAVEVPVDVGKIPLFVKAGSILPLGEAKQHTGQRPDDAWEIRIYPGANATYTIYEDNGVDYAYEKGQRSTCTLTWDDASGTLTISSREGAYEGMVPRRQLHIVKVSKDKGTGLQHRQTDKTVWYAGEALRLHL